MASTYGELLLTVYELEGLLLVLEKHGADTPASVIQLIKEKAASVALQAENVQLPEQSPEEEMLNAALHVPDEQPEESQPEECADETEPLPAAPEDDVPPQFVKCTSCGKVLPGTYAFCNECGAELAAEPQTPDEPASAIEVPIDEDAEFVAPEPIADQPEEEEEEFEEVETEEEEEIFDLSLIHI